MTKVILLTKTMIDITIFLHQNEQELDGFAKLLRNYGVAEADSKYRA